MIFVLIFVQVSLMAVSATPLPPQYRVRNHSLAIVDFDKPISWRKKDTAELTKKACNKLISNNELSYKFITNHQQTETGTEFCKREISLLQRSKLIFISMQKNDTAKLTKGACNNIVRNMGVSNKVITNRHQTQMNSEFQR